MIKSPIVSVVMTVYNAEPYLVEAVDSILSQTLGELELIAINDGSTDASGDLLDRYSILDDRVRVIHQENYGIYAAANRGFELARGKYLARMDADDIAFPDRLNNQISIMEKDVSLILLGTAYELIDKDGSVIRLDRLPESDMEIRWHLLFNNPFAQSTVMFKKDFLRKWELQHDPGIKFAGDYHLWSKLVNYGKARNLPAPSVQRRYHSSQVSETSSTAQQENATKISQKNLEDLGINLSINKVAKLRSWHRCFPKVISQDEVELCFYLVDILNKFSGKPGLNKKELGIIRGRWILKMMLLNAERNNNFQWKNQIIKMLDKQDIINIFGYIYHRLMDRG